MWATSFGEPLEWSGEDDPDRELATEQCAGCPVRADCLELVLRIAGAGTLGVGRAEPARPAGAAQGLVLPPAG
jgi:WhiB family transcriptional regulator, redox-sensing transcriptional regulator